MSTLLQQAKLVQEQWELSGALLEFAAEGDFALVRAVTDVFLADTDGKLNLLQEAVVRQDVAAAQRIAHSLKGAARQIGTFRLADDAEQLEQCSAETDETNLALLVTTIANRWCESKRAIVDGLESECPVQAGVSV